MVNFVTIYTTKPSANFIEILSFLRFLNYLIILKKIGRKTAFTLICVAGKIVSQILFKHATLLHY